MVQGIMVKRQYHQVNLWRRAILATAGPIGLYRENTIAIESEARNPNGGMSVCVHGRRVRHNATYVSADGHLRVRNVICILAPLKLTHITTVWIYRLVLDHAIAAIQTIKAY